MWMVILQIQLILILRFLGNKKGGYKPPFFVVNDDYSCSSFVELSSVAC